MFRESMTAVRRVQHIRDREPDPLETWDNNSSPNGDDLVSLLAMFPYCDVEQLIAAILHNQEELKLRLDDVLTQKILIGLECAIESSAIGAISEFIALSAVLFRVDWPKHDSFLKAAYPLLSRIFEWPDFEMPEETWHDCLDAVCYALLNVDIDDPSTMDRAITAQINYIDSDVSFEDRSRAVQFLTCILGMYGGTPEQIAILEKFREEVE
jgi:hypothetical protein